MKYQVLSLNLLKLHEYNLSVNMKYIERGVYMTANVRGLKTRKNLSSTVENELLDKLRALSDETKVPISKLLDEAIEDLLVKRKPSK